jgi:hypothetical protein
VGSSRRTRVLLVAFALGATVLYGDGAHRALAHDHDPPRAVLHSRQVRQRGNLGTYCWVQASEEPGVFQEECAEATWFFPSAKNVAGRGTTIRLYTRHAPDRLSLHRWRRLNRYGAPRGRGQDVAFELRRRIANRVYYELRFRLPPRQGHTYLYLFGVWKDVEGSGLNQDADWTFHVRRE